MPGIIPKALIYMFSFNYHNNPWHGSHHPHFTNEHIKLEKLSTPGHPGERSDRMLN